jgi:hypothetical protein
MPKRFTAAEMKHMQRLANKANIGAIKRQVEGLNHNLGEYAFAHYPITGKLELLKVKRITSPDGRPGLRISKKLKLELAKKGAMLLHTHPKSSKKEPLLVTPSVHDILDFLESPLKKEGVLILNSRQVAATVVMKKSSHFLSLSKAKRNEIINELLGHLNQVSGINAPSVTRFKDVIVEGFNASEEYHQQSEIDHMLRTNSLKRFGINIRIVPSKGYKITQNKNGDTIAKKK